MHAVAIVLVVLVALEHAWFLILEMFLWQKPIGLRTFNNTPQKAADTAVLAANQGLYNGFLAAGLIFALAYPEPAAARAVALFFLACIVVAGLYGGWSVSRRIVIVQAVPAAVAFLVVWFA
jgi:putative membrane protein